MNGPAFRAIFRTLKTCALSFFVLATLYPGSGRAQSASPTVVDFWIKSNTLFLELKWNAEAMLTGNNPAQPAAFSNDPNYKSLRRMFSSELEPQIKEFVHLWKQNLVVEAPERLSLSYEGVRIPVVGNTEKVRVSKLLLTAPLPDQASNLRLTWPSESGPIVLRQQNVAAPYTGYLAAGEASPLIPLQGGASLTKQQTLQTYFTKGVDQFLRNPIKPSILVLALVFLSLKLRPVVSQLVFLSAGALIGLGLGLYGVLDAGKVNEATVLVASTIVLALWNLVARRLQVWRLLAVLAIGGLQGLVFASALIGIGVPPDHLPPAILGFGAGNILPLVVVAFAGLALALLFSGGSHRKRGRVSVLASMLIAGAGVYWIVEPWVQG